MAAQGVRSETAEITVFVRDLIGLPKFSNVAIAAAVKEEVTNDDDFISDEFNRCAKMVEVFLGEQRDSIITALEEQS